MRLPPVRWVIMLLSAEACEGADKLYNVFDPAAPAADVPCPGTETTSPWVPQTVPVDRGLSGIWGTSASDVWAVGGRGTVLHYDGSSWSDVSPGTIVEDLLSIHGTGVDDIWVAGKVGVAAHWDGQRWSTIDTALTEDILGVYAPSAGDAWIVSVSGPRRWDGAAFSRDSSWPTSQVNAVWAAAPDAVYFVGNTETHHFDGAKITSQAIAHGGMLTSVWGTDAMNVWTIGQNASSHPGFGELVNGKWLFTAVPPRAFYFRVYAVDPSELFAGASDTTIYRRSNGHWCRELTGGIGAVTGFFGANAGDIWGVGSLRGSQDQPKPILLRRH
jgi:hypothetical protein